MRSPQNNKYNNSSFYNGISDVSLEDVGWKQDVLKKLHGVKGSTWSSHATVLALAYLGNLSAVDTPWLFGAALLLAVISPMAHEYAGVK